MRVCSIAACGARHCARGLCTDHYQEAKRTGALAQHALTRIKGAVRLCSLDGCGERHYGQGLCHNHWKLRRANGDPLVMRRAANGKGNVNQDGYRVVHIPGHPNSDKTGKISEHRLVMAERLGRALLPHEVVHHINGDRLDNRPENLELWSTSQPRGQRVIDKLAWAREIIATYGHMVPED